MRARREAPYGTLAYRSLRPYRRGIPHETSVPREEEEAMRTRFALHRSYLVDRYEDFEDTARIHPYFPPQYAHSNTFVC